MTPDDAKQIEQVFTTVIKGIESNQSQKFVHLEGKIEKLETIMSEIKTKMAVQESKDLQKEIDKLNSEMDTMKDFKSRIYGALSILTIVWVIIQALLIFYLTNIHKN